jgi:PST family polysaccharide transporter
MTLIKTSLLSFIATVIKLLSGLVINKAVAIYIGPSGLALIGQLQNFMQLSMTAGQGAINTGVTKYTAEYAKDTDKLTSLFSTAAKISATCSIVVGSLIAVLSNLISDTLFKTQEYQYVFVIFGFTIILFVFNSLLLSILNGLKEIKTFIAINITQSIYSLIFTTGLIYFFALDGVLIALVTNQSFIFIFLLWYLKDHNIIILRNFKQKIDFDISKKLSKYALMAIISGISVPMSHITIRNYLGDNLGLEQAGYWQAIWYISSMYLMVVTTALSTYYLPRLSEIDDKIELRNELINGYKVIIPIVCIASIGVFLCKDLIISLLFTSEFQPMLELFLWQLVGDVLKIAAWLLAYVMLAKTMTKTFVITEIIFAVSFVVLSIICVESYGLIGMTYAFAMNYFLYFLIMFFIVKREVL